MHENPYVFAQLVSFLDRNHFNYLVRKYSGDRYVKHFTCFDLCLELFEWAMFRSTKGGVKIHALLDVETQVPSFLLITEAKVNDVNAMDSIPYEVRSYYVFDRAYNDFEHLARIDSMGSFFVVRTKTNMLYEIIETKEKLADNILKDCRITLTGLKTKKTLQKADPYGGILRYERQTNIHLSDKFEQDFCKPGCRTLQEPLASGAVF